MFAFSPHDLQAIWLSARVATLATILALPFAILLTYILVYRRFPGKMAVEGLINLPLVLPPVVTGYLLLLLFSERSGIGTLLQRFNIEVVFTIRGAVIAAMVVGFPLMVRSIRIGMEGIDERLLQASRTLGARWWDTLLTVILPLSVRSIMAGMTLMFARSLGEFGATIVLAGNIPGVTRTIPLAIYDHTATPGGETMALSLSLVSIILSFAVLLTNEHLSKKIKGERRE